MKACYLDANILVYFGNKSSPLHGKTIEVLNKLAYAKYRITISSLSLDEFLHTLLRFSEDSKSITLSKAKIVLRRIFKLPEIQLINPPIEHRKHYRVVGLMAKYGLDSRDAYHLFIMKENKVKFMATFDSDFDKIFKSGFIKRFE